jgi:hypothetical protein
MGDDPGAGDLDQRSVAGKPSARGWRALQAAADQGLR